MESGVGKWCSDFCGVGHSRYTTVYLSVRPIIIVLVGMNVFFIFFHTVSWFHPRLLFSPRHLHIDLTSDNTLSVEW